MNASDNGPDPASRRSISSSDLIPESPLRYRLHGKLIPKDSIRYRLYWNLRRYANLAFPYYRRMVPTGIRALIPRQVRLIARWALGVSEHDVRIWHLKLKLQDLGFCERAAKDLSLISESSDPALAQRASWMLAVWYANQRSTEGAAEALRLLEQALGDEPSDEMRRREAVLKAECHATLGDIDAAREVVACTLRTDPHPDILLAAANLHALPDERLTHINVALRLYGLSELSLHPDKGDTPYDQLAVMDRLETAEGPKVTVIVPAFNAADHINTAMEALIAQTWTNFEALVVDDLSSDNTAEVVADFSARDHRIKLIRAEANRGSYVARNIALREATGEFVTTHDSDDWSHPRKLEIQARHLIDNPSVTANMSQQARTASDLLFHRRGNPGFYIFDNMSSLMFRRERTTSKLGSWDSVRFAADSEFIARLRLVFGENAVASLRDAGPLSFQRQLESSLTGSSAFGYPGFFMGARLAYHQSSRRHHRSAKRLFYEFPQNKRPFPVPEPMLPVRETAKGLRRFFDEILASDFRIPGAVSARNIAHIEEQRLLGRRIGLIQMSRYDFEANAESLPVFNDLEDRGEVQFIVVGERVACERLVVLHAPVLEEFQRFVPDVEAKKVEVRVPLDDTPLRLTTPELLRDWLDVCQRNAERHFGNRGEWTCDNSKLAVALREPQPARGGSMGEDGPADGS